MSDERKKLVQLPDGSWVDLGRIIGIHTIQGEWNKSLGASHESRVAVRISLPGDVLDCRLFDCKSPEEALALRDWIAAMANTNSPP